MSYSNFGRGRGFGPQGTRAARCFGRPRFPRPPFRHAGPPRPVHPASFGVPWQPSNRFFQPNPLRGSPQFRSDGRRRRFGGYNFRFPAPNRLPAPPDHEEAAESAPSGLQLDLDQDEAARQLPLLGSEEERQQKIIKTANQLKERLSSFSNDEMIDWSEDVSSNPIKEDFLENRRISLVGYKSAELNMTYNDLKDIGRINSDNVKLDDSQHAVNIYNIANNADSDVILDENENGSHLVISNDRMTSLENVPDSNEYTEIDNWEFHKPIDDSHNLEQSDLQGNNDIENELIEPDLQYQYDTLPANISIDQDDQQQQDTLQEIEVYPTDATKEQESEMLNVQTVPIDSVNQDILQEDQETLQNEDKFTNLEVQESILNSHAESSNSNNSTLIQPVLGDMSVNNVVLDKQLSKVKENSFHSGPPKLSPHTEQELPVDFDPSTPPPILLKQDQRILPPYSIPPDLPPLFDPTAPPPNMKCLVGPNISHEDANPAWSNAQNPMPANVYKNIEVHTGLNTTHSGFMFQQLSLEMPCQNNVFLPPHVDPVNFSPIFPMSSNHSGTHVPSMLPQMHATPHNIYVSPSSLPELSPSSDLPCSMNKDDGLDDMQEAMKFAKQMTSITGRADEESKSSSKSLSENSISINPVSDVESIALPPGRPKAKTNKLKKVKEDGICNKKNIVSGEQSTADCVSSEETIQDANVKSRDVLLMKEQDRPKVIFNLNNKTKIMNSKTWQENNEKKNGMTQSVELEKTRLASSVTSVSIFSKKNFENTLRHDKEENLQSNENNSGNTMLSESIANQDAIVSRKKSQKDVHAEKSQCSNVSLYSQVKELKSRSHIEKRKNFNMVTSWKNKIISRFLKMSKNDIYNMVNNTSLKKFDIIMKRLVKEKKPTLSLEMRNAQNEKMKLYDQQEFMKQLNAMLDTNSVVSITDLPTEFIHHLNDVLQLDVQPDNHTEFAATSSNQCDYSENINHSENINYALHPAPHITECANETTSNDVNKKCIRNRGHATKTPYNKDIQTHDTNDLNFNTCNTIVTNDPSISSNLLTLQHDLDDIFSEVTKKNQNPASVKERKRCSTRQQNAKKFDIDAISRSVEKETVLENDRAHRLDDYPRWDEKCDRWKRKEWEDPHAYRNLTKEEWEARYGTQANSSTPPLTDTSSYTKKIVVNDKTLSTRGRGRKVCLRRRYSSESSRHPPNTRHRSLEKDKHKKSRRHSDDRRHSTGYLEHDYNHDSNSSSRSSSSSSNSSSSSSSSNSSNSSNSSDSSDNTNVTKLLRVIKENEKVAKKMTLNEAIRDEVNAEIERERRSRKLRKDSTKSRKQREAHYEKKRRQGKKTTSSSNSSPGKDNNNETIGKLLTESEIKKETVESQTMQEVIVKEEIDIGQEENVENAVEDEFASASSLVMENKVAYLLPASQSRLESPSGEEIPLATVNATQLHVEDRLPTASPTHPKTKAQLKQMPEASDMNDNKVPLNAFTCIPEDWSSALNPANLSECTEDIGRSCRTAGVGGNQDAGLPTFTKQDDNTARVSNREADESAASRQLDTAAPTFAESSAKDGNEIAATDNNDASSVSSVPPATTVTRKQGASKKIDIKTYYERHTIRRRMNEKLESKRPAEKRATSPRESSLAAKTTEPEIAAKPAEPANKSASTYGGSIQDPRLVSARVALAPCAPSSKDDVAQATSGRNVRQKGKRTKESTIAELTPRRPEDKTSSRVADSDGVVKKPNRDKSKDKAPLAIKNIKVLSNVIVPKNAAPKSKKACSETKESVADKKSQSQVSSDPKRFKNIRSEGSKELKLKEMAREQKAKKKSASKPVGLVSAKVPLEKSTEEKTETAQEKKIDNINKTEMERVQLTGSRKAKVNNSNTKTEPPAISSGNAGNDNKLPRDVEAKEPASSLDVLGRENTEKTVSDVINTRKRASKTTRDKEARHVKRAKSLANVEIEDKKGQGAREVSDVSTASKTAPEAPGDKVPSEIEKVDAEDLSRVQRLDARNTELPSTRADQSRIEKSSGQDPSEGVVDVSSISELDGKSRSADGADVRSKGDQLLTNSDVKTDRVKENNMELNVLDKSASANEDESLAKKTAGLSSASNENFREQQGTTSSDSVGSPFKGFLQETMMDFEQPSLFDFKLDEVDEAGKKSKIFLDDCNVDYGTSIAGDAKIEGPRENYGTLGSGTDYAVDPSINANENFDITFNHPLLTSDKECTACEKADRLGLAANESGEGHVKKSASEIIATTLHDEDDINIDGSGGETEGPLMSKEGYTCAGLTMKESMFINEEEIQGETRKDLASKLKTTTDPSLSDALETTISDDALPESQVAEHLDNQMYLETNIAAEKAACDKLPGFDSDEHLDSDMFYLDDRLGAAAFDNKDDESVHFPVHQPSPPYSIAPAVTPEAMTIAAGAKPEECKFDLKHTPSASDDFAGTSAEGSPTNPPRTLNIPTKAALKEPAANLFFKSPADVPTATKEALATSDTARPSEADLNYHAGDWHVNGQNNVKTQPPVTPRDNTITQNSANVNTSPARKDTCDMPARKDGDRGKVAQASNHEDHLRGIQRTPVVELRKMKELEKLLEKKGREDSTRMENGAYGGQRKHNGTILHKLKDKRQLKHQSKGMSNRIGLVKRLKKMRRTGRLAGTTREAILARMLEIDLEMHKLATEKLKLHEILSSNILPTESSTACGDGTRVREDVAVAGQHDPLVSQNGEVSGARHAPSRPARGRKRVSFLDPEDEVASHAPVYQKTKMPVIRWKKKPRLEQIRREDDEKDKEDEENEEEKGEEEEEKEEDPDDPAAERQTSACATKKAEDGSTDISEDARKADSAAVDDEAREEKTPEKSGKETDTDSRRAVCPDKSADDRSEWQEEGETERAKQPDTDKQNDAPAAGEAPRTESQPSSGQVGGTPEPPSIYSDDSTWDSLVQNTASEMHERRKVRGLLNESLKRELARSRKMKAIVRKKQKEQLDNYLRTVNNLTMQEEELPLSKLYIRKLQQKRDLLDSLSQRKEDLNLVVDPSVLKKMDEVINAVAENRVENLYESELEARAFDDAPATSDTSPVLQPDNQFYVDAEANANSDWPCREKENLVETTMRQESNDMSGTEGSNHVFKAVSQDKGPFHEERNVEPDSSITPEETLMESQSSDCERDRPKVSNASCNFDIKVSVPKILIKNDFSLGLLQKLKDTEVGGPIDSTTNVSSANTERLEEKDTNSQSISQAVKSTAEEHKKDEKGETEDKRTADVNEREEIVDSVIKAPSAPQSSTANSDVTENEESGDSVASNRYDKIAVRDTERDSDSTVEKTDTKQKKSDVESDQVSDDAIASKENFRSVENAAAKVEEKSNPENKSTFERILDHDQSTSSSVPADLASEKSEESNETSIEQKSDLEHTTSTFSFNKATAKGGETSKKLSRKQGSSTPIRRSTRNTNENIKSSRIKEADVNSNSSEQGSGVLHERNFTTRSRSKSPTWAMPDERITNNGRKKRVAQKKLQNRKIGAKSKTKIQDPVKYFDMIAESVISKNKITKKRKPHTEWQMKNCKVRLIDCKSALLKYINPEVLDRLGIANPCASNDTSCNDTQCTTSNQNTTIPIAASDESSFFPDKSCDKAKSEVEILEEEPVTENSDKNLVQESVSIKTDEEESKMQYTVHKGPILDIKVAIR